MAPQHFTTPDSIADLKALRCLQIGKSALERMQQNLRQNASVFGLLNEIILPATLSTKSALRDLGMHCLGLCCYLDKALAKEKVEQFLYAVRNLHLELQIKALQIIFDLVMLFGFDELSEHLKDKDALFVLFAESSGESEGSIQTTATLGVSKLLLAKIIHDLEPLKSMFILYYHPSTADNPAMRQCLSYFLQAYCKMSPSNHESVRCIFFELLNTLSDAYYECVQTGEAGAMVTPLAIGQQIIDWTDPRHALAKEREEVDVHVEHAMHAQLCVDLLKEAFTDVQENRRLYVQLLPRLCITPATSDILLRQTILLGHHLLNADLDNTTFRAVDKFLKQIDKMLASPFDPDAAVQVNEHAELRKILEFLSHQNLDVHVEEEESELVSTEEEEEEE
jgi:condensin complex subunit 3